MSQKRKEVSSIEKLSKIVLASMRCNVYKADGTEGMKC